MFVSVKCHLKINQVDLAKLLVFTFYWIIICGEVVNGNGTDCDVINKFSLKKMSKAPMNFPILIFLLLAFRSSALVQFGGQKIKNIQRGNQQQQQPNIDVFLDRRNAFRRVLATTTGGLLLSEAFPNIVHAKVRFFFFWTVLSVPFIFLGLA